MSCKSLMLGISWLIIPLLFFGCGDNSPKSQKKITSQKQKLAVPAPPKKNENVASVSEVKDEKDEKKFSYNSAGKRDPFEAFAPIKRSAIPAFVATTPLQKFALDNLQVIGVIWGLGQPTAMVNAPDGKSYILKKGVKAGKNNGTVIDINKETIVVEEEFYDFSGAVKVRTKNIPLPKKEGAE